MSDAFSPAAGRSESPRVGQQPFRPNAVRKFDIAGQTTSRCHGRRSDLVTDDIAGLSVASALLTTYGGRTSHAAVVARQLNKVCLVGCAELKVDEAARSCSIGSTVLREGDWITLDGEAGLVYLGRVPVMRERPVEALAEVERWRH